MSEERTFNKLRQLPVDEMVVLLDNIQRPPLMFTLGNTAYERRDYYHELNFQLEKINLLKEYGWTVEDFYKELEKKSILAIVEEYNASVGFPQDILDRAKRLFPHIKFTPASIELE